MRRWVALVERFNPPRFTGLVGSLLLISASIGYGVVKGDHVAMTAELLRDAPNAVANAAGLHIAAVSLSGEKHVSRAEIFAAAGVNEHASLLLLNVDKARDQLKAIPWIADAMVRKLYPDRLQIAVTERSAFALWQRAGKVSVISADGTVVSEAPGQFLALPFVVGRGADTRARDFLTLLDRYPAIRDQVRASILVAERRWNLRLKNGIDVRLPENDIEQALDRLVELDRDKGLLTRDITTVDLRLPDRVTVRLSQDASQAREDALKEKDKKPAKRKGGDA
ncbi:MAG TPA: cell division protein FtsQ/DivIB [Xanthobacteraceae bacterium]|jgi:cell division protein FtsQ|nr:cell division protein FtsQ/DivIB [Xanthobacteraceae bacterium]